MVRVGTMVRNLNAVSSLGRVFSLLQISQHSLRECTGLSHIDSRMAAVLYTEEGNVSQRR